MRKLRVLEILEGTVGGTREHLFQIARYLDPRRFRLTIAWSPRRDPQAAEDVSYLRGLGANVFVVPMCREIRPIQDLVALARLWSHIVANRYDIVHTHSSKAGMLGRLAAWAAGVRQIYHTPHTFAFQWAAGVASRFYCQLERLAALVTTRLIAVSPTQRDIARRSRVCRPEKLLVIENGVNVQECAPETDQNAVRAELGVEPQELLIGMVGRLAPQKGCEHFVRAAQQVAERYPQARFVLVGDGPLRPEIERLIERLGLRARFQLLGFRQDVHRIYAALDLFVLSSLWEGMPYAVLEAMAAGLPVVATDVPGTRDAIIDGATGLLAQIEDEADIAAKLMHLLADDKLRHEMGERARRMVSERYTADRFIRRLQALYEEGWQARRTRRRQTQSLPRREL